MSKFSLTCGLLVLAVAARAHDDATAEYLGNAGVLVTHDDIKIVFDAFYRNSYDQYVLVADATEEALRAGSVPYDGVDAVFVSHAHGDHFSAEPTLLYLRVQPSVRLYGSVQVIDAIRTIASDADALDERLIAVDAKPGDAPVEIKVGSMIIEVVAIPHSGDEETGEIDNLAFRVVLGADNEHHDLTVLHLGDATTQDDFFVAQQAHWDARSTDVAFPPYWFMMGPEGKAILEERIRAKKNIGVHVPTRAIGAGDAWREHAGADLFTDPGETREF